MRPIENYEESESTGFTFIGRAEGSPGGDMLDKVAECLIGLNLQPMEGWGWVADGTVLPGDAVRAAIEQVAGTLSQTSTLDDQGRQRLAREMADAIANLVPDFDRDEFLAKSAGRRQRA